MRIKFMSKTKSSVKFTEDFVFSDMLADQEDHYLL
jgi:hypothetical protein